MLRPLILCLGLSFAAPALAQIAPADTAAAADKATYVELAERWRRHLAQATVRTS